MASRYGGSFTQAAGRSSIDLPLAALAALAVAFVAFAMPGELLSRAVELSRLPSVLSAAEPPLGGKARAAVSLAAAAATFAAVFLLLRMLGGRPAPRRPVADEAEDIVEIEAPRLRRSDVHPDAPARRPILAARELGEPEPSRDPAAPFWRPEDFPQEPEAERADVPDEALDLAGPDIEMIEPAAPHSAQAAFPEAPPEPEFEPGREAGDASIPELMARLERGLARRLQQKAVPAPIQRPPAPAPAAAPHFAAEGDDRLRSAIENLQQMAARAR